MGNEFKINIERYKQRREKLIKKLQQIQNGECKISENEFDDIQKEINEINKYFHSDNVLCQYEIDRLLSILSSTEDDDLLKTEDDNFIIKISSEFFTPYEYKCITSNSPIIVLSPINKRILSYLLNNPQELYNLSSESFEIVMAEIYAKLGYNVERTQKTHDGGKDIIIRKSELLGDFIYYVECKKYSPQNHIGVGLVKEFLGTIDTDRINGGIIATTSFFSLDSKKFIFDNKYNCIIQMHDYDKIKELLMDEKVNGENK